LSRIKKIFYTSSSVIVILWIIYLALTPVVSRDALILHMAFTKAWAERSFFYFWDYNLSTLSMMNLDYIYMLFFRIFEGDGAQKLFHAICLLSSASYLFIFLKKRIGTDLAFFISVAFTLVPINQRLSSEVYVDLGVLFFSTIAVIHFVKWLESDQASTKELIISAIGSGLAFGTKYTGAIAAVSFIVTSGLIHSKKTQNSFKSLKVMTLYSIIVIIMIAPWLCRNFAAIGNPFNPFLNSIFKPDIITVETNLSLSPGEYATRKIFGESALDILIIPLRFFFAGKDNDLIGGFDGVLNPMLLVLLIPLLFPRFRNNSPHKEIIKSLFWILLIMLAFFLAYGHLRIRYFIFSLPIIAILNALTLKIVSDSMSKKVSFMIITLSLSLFFSYNLIYSANIFRKLDTLPYITGSETKEEYLRRMLSEYKVAEKINLNAPNNAVIYEVLCGHRTYHINRTVVYDDFFLDRYLYNMIDTLASNEDYLRHFSNLPFSEHKKADFLMIKPYGFAITYKQAFAENQPDSIADKKIMKFKNFLDSQFLVFDSNGTYVYSIIYDKTEGSVPND
jgi:hypothetical protein